MSRSDVNLSLSDDHVSFLALVSLMVGGIHSMRVRRAGTKVRLTITPLLVSVGEVCITADRVRTRTLTTAILT